ncbi:MAG: BCD family MFS transporter [Rhodocyclaceae bacterium]|nr:BCD family MFS transporter [Rhodocyclaceae bacterium]
MVVELALPALLPGLLVAIHYALQILRPRMGFGSDRSGRRTPWIVGGMAVLAAGGVTAALATAWMASAPTAGLLLAVLGFVMIGVGVSAAGTSLLVLLAKSVAEHRRAPAATLVWIMMIAGFAVTAGTAGSLLDPYSPERLVEVAVGVAALAVVVTLLALFRLEADAGATPNDDQTPFLQALRRVWREADARQFTVFIFVSMLAFSAQDLILEPFAGLVFGFTPGESTRLAGVQHSGVMAGMILVALAGSRRGRPTGQTLRLWTVSGCIASALALLGLVAGGALGGEWPLKANVFLLGAANGAFSIAAIASMMQLAGRGESGREGVRMGLWGAAQAIAFGLGGLGGAVASDVARQFIAAPGLAYGSVFFAEALLFLASARLATAIPARPAIGAAKPEPTDLRGVATPRPATSAVT